MKPGISSTSFSHWIVRASRNSNLVRRASACDRFSVPLRRLESMVWLVETEGTVRMTRQGLLRVDRLLELLYLPRHQGVGYW